MSKAITDLPASATLTGDELIEVSQLSTTTVYTAATISAQASDNSYNDSAAQFVAEGFAVGDRVNVVGFTGDVANNIFVGFVTALTAGKMTIGGTDGDVIVDDSAGESVTIAKWTSRRATTQDIADLGGGGSGGSVEVYNEGVVVDAAATKIDFTGSGVTASQTAPGEVAVNVPGGGGGGGGAGFVGYQSMLGYAAGNFSAGNLGGIMIIADRDFTLDDIRFFASAASASAVLTPAVYAIDTSTRKPGVLLATGTAVNGAVAGENVFPLSSPLAVLAGDVIFIGVQVKTANVSITTNNANVGFYFTSTGAVDNPAPSTINTAGFIFWGYSSG